MARKHTSPFPSLERNASEVGPAAAASPLAEEAGEIRFRLLDSIGEMPRGAWDAMFPGAAEDWECLRAAEDCCPAGFRLGAIAGHRGGAVVAAAPVFRTTYELHTSLRGWPRRLMDRLGERAPGLLRPGVLALGSPLLDRCQIGFAPEIGAAERPAVLGGMLRSLLDTAARERTPLLAVKDLSEADAAGHHATLAAHGFARIANVPMAYIDLPFENEAAYLAHLPQKTAGYLRRKMRALSRLRIEHRTSVAGLGPQLNGLYQSTRANSKSQYGDFDELHPAYFETVLERCGPKALLMLCWSGETLVGFQLSLIGEDEIVTKYIGMRYPEARELNLYFINWLMLFRTAYERGIRRVRMGNTSYSVKLLLGGRLEKSWIYFRHRKPAVNWAFHRLAPLMDFERNDPELVRLAAEGRVPGG